MHEQHWLQLPDDVRRTISSGFPILPLNEMAYALALPPNLLELWHHQHITLEYLRNEMLRNQQENPNQNLGEIQYLVEAVVTYCRGTTTKKLAKALDEIISSTTILRWHRKLKGIKEMRILVDKDGRPIATDPFKPRIGVTAVAENTNGAIPQTVEDTTKSFSPRPPKSEALPPLVALADSMQAAKLKSLLSRHDGKSRRKYSQIEKSHLVYMVDTYGPKQAHEYFRVSFDTLARLKRQFDTESPERKQRIPSRYEIVLQIMTKHPGMGPMQIRDYLARHKGLKYGVNSIRRVMEQSGWVPPYTKKSRIDTDLRRFEAVRKNYMWHIDFKHHYINNIKVAILLIQDDYSRFLVGHSYADSENAHIVISAIQESIAIYGRPESIMTDGGSAFFSWQGISQFQQVLEDYGIDHYRAKSANVNGKIESVCCQIEKELLNTQTYASLTHFASELAQWVGHYNFMRVHQGLPSGLVPADRYFPGAYKWYDQNSNATRKQALVAETMANLLQAIKKQNE